jgi:hypothetical protein
MVFPNDPTRPITRFILGDRLVVADGRRGALERIIYRTGASARYELRWDDGTTGMITIEDIVGIESDDGVQLPLWQ